MTNTILYFIKKNLCNLRNQREIFNFIKIINSFIFLRNDKHKIQSLCSLWILCVLCVKNLCNQRNQREIFNSIKIINFFRFLRKDKHKMQSLCSLCKNSVLSVLKLCEICGKYKFTFFLESTRNFYLWNQSLFPNP